MSARSTGRPSAHFSDPRELMVDRSKSVIRNGYFELGNNEKPKSTLSFVTKSMLNISDKDLVQKGIKVPAGETFHYCQEAKGLVGVYIFEAGFSHGHSERVKENVYIYIICNEKKVLIGTLSSQHPRIELNLMMFGNFQLIHTSKRKTVLFNACQFSRVPISDGVLHSYENMHFWVKDIKPFKGTTIDPIAEERKYHILRVFSGTDIKESIGINVQFHNKSQKIGTLSPGDEEFTLSNTSETADVSVSGYTVPYFSLKELPGAPDDECNLKPVKEC